MDYTLANVGKRIFACFVDLFVIIIYVILMSFLLEHYNNFNGYFSKGRISLLIICYLPAVLYFPVLEYFLKGKTLGKAIFRIRVAKVDGKPPSAGEALLRWLMRGIDMKIGLLFFLISALFESTGFFSNRLLGAIGFFMVFPFPIVGLIAVLSSRNNQRIGDLAADTIVIYEEKRITLEDTILQTNADDHEVTFPEAIQLRDKDIYIIKDVIKAAEEKMDHSQVLPLTRKAKEVLNVSTNLLPLVFLKTLIKDYTYLARKKDLD